MMINNNLQDNQDNQKEYITKFPNIVLLHIIRQVTNNVDLICLSLSCKKLYGMIVGSHHITFSSVGYIYIDVQSHWLVDNGVDVRHASSLFKLKSFKSLFKNALSNQLLISEKEDNDNDTSFNNNSLMINLYAQEEMNFHGYKCHTRYQNAPISISRIYIKGRSTVPPTFSMYPFFDNLNSVYADAPKVPDDPDYRTLLPRTLTQLDIGMQKLTSPNYFQSLDKLVELKVVLVVFDHCQTINFNHLHNLRKLSLTLGLVPKQCSIDASNIQLPPNLTSLALSHFCNLGQNTMTTQFFPTGLIELEVELGGHDYSSISLSHLTSLTRLTIHCLTSVPPGFIPRTVLHLTLDIMFYDVGLLEGSIPDTVESLTLEYNGQTDNMFDDDDDEGITFITDILNNPTTILPQSLKNLTWNVSTAAATTPLSLHSYPPQLEYLKGGLIDINTIPSTLTTLDLIIHPQQQQQQQIGIQIPIYSIPSINQLDNNSHTDSNNNNNNILPNNLKKLIVRILPEIENNNKQLFSFRLDEIINQTSVGELTIYTNISDRHVQLSIRRLDSKNANVLVVGDKSLFGGVIQQKQQKQQINGNYNYPPLYLTIHGEYPLCIQSTPAPYK
ncbi:hypothetical protein DFA_03990 [Cavenderia fasciculata]|uniref:Uncharacterized protein n=1 Tax=Cavenderia fasciculata TaxID=261658 RepID=F4Q0Z5_CACFS|nr:uncharacterized protein DFA_03990 [Cavenderia fasciculata]EGG18496.1 hypothetical protein DFA_03990 [Cavenderia fasciculata]|eukprot:XP_004366400.1 hypothetical protein DFA_03990 [Cavenderia fasciculata]